MRGRADRLAARAAHEPAGVVPVLRHYLRDLVYGANDGIITTFAVVAGVAGASLSARIVLILGVANLLADGISMGASNFLSIRSNEAALAAEGADEEEPFAVRHGIATFFAFVIAGALPLVAYIAPVQPALRFPTAIVLTAVTMFGVGAARTVFSRRRWWIDGLEMLTVGAVASAAAYGAGALIASVTAGAGP